MLHISICDDEIVAVEKMRKIVGKVLEQEQLLANVGTFENGEEFLNQYIIRDDELVILDLDMPIKSGIDVIQELEKIQRNEVVILVTAYDNLAIQSFSYGPFQIIRKERLEEDLPKAVSRFLKMRQRKQEVLEFQVKGEIIHTKVSDIVYFEKCQHHVYVHLRDQTVLCIRKNMQDFEKELAGKGFVRTHAAYIVALKYCKKFEKNDIILVGSILFNLLDNAIEACEKNKKEKRIVCQIAREADEVNIFLENSIDQSVLAENPSFETTKDKKDQHGMGHLIVEEQVKRLGGMVEYYEDEMFCAHIYLPM